MALISCPECSKEISDKAAACPNCGCPMADVLITDKGINNKLAATLIEEGEIKEKCKIIQKRLNKVIQEIGYDYNCYVFDSDKYRKLNIQRTDTYKDIMFKAYILLYGNTTDTIKTLRHNEIKMPGKNVLMKYIETKDLADLLYYDRGNDIDITLVAKMLNFYAHRNDMFLKWQIEVILIHGDIDMQKECIEFLELNENRDFRYENYRYWLNL